MSDIQVRLANWKTDNAELRHIRESVFVQEQHVPIELEMDEQDTHCVHALAVNGSGSALGTGRLLEGGKIGRMAVLKSARGLGIGRALLDFLTQIARERGDKEAILGAQLHAIPFYEKSGYHAFGEVYLDAGIEHRWMRKVF